jgi:uncharacterized protein YkwD
MTSVFTKQSSPIPSRVFKVGFRLIALLFISASLGSIALAQKTESYPVARLITATSNSTRLPHVTTSRVASRSLLDSRSPSAEDANSIERRAFEQTNLVRVQNGLPPLVWDADLSRMARSHSENMARLGFFSHVTPAGQGLKERARVAGIAHYSAVGENIAYNLGYDDPGEFAVERWMTSAGHRANILDAGYRAMAVGTFVAADGSVFLTQTFLTR